MAKLTFGKYDKTETTLSVDWEYDTSGDETVTLIQAYSKVSTASSFSLRVSKSFSAASQTIMGELTITGLTQNQHNDVYLKVTTTSSTTVQSTTKTYWMPNYPYIISISSNPLVISELLTTMSMNISNPLYRDITVYMKQNNTSGTTLWSEKSAFVGQKTSFIYSETLYKSIPNSTSGIAVYYAVYDNHIVNTITGIYKIRGDEIPNYINTQWGYTSTNKQSLTNSNKTVIKGYSDIIFNLITNATSNYYATIKNYVLEWGNSTSSKTATGTYTLSGTNGSGQTLAVTAVDSRGLRNRTTANIPSYYYVDYNNPTIDSIDTNRTNGIEADVKLNLSGTMFNGDFGNNGVTNELYSANYYVSTDNTNWSSAYSIPISNFTVDGSNFSLEDYTIHANGTSGGFVIGTKYYVKVEIKDAQGLLGTAITTSIVSDGKIARTVYKDSDGEYHEGINGLADDDYTETINGTLLMKDNIVLDNAHFLKGMDADNTNIINLIRASGGMCAIGDTYYPTKFWSSEMPTVYTGGTTHLLNALQGCFMETVLSSDFTLTSEDITTVPLTNIATSWITGNCFTVTSDGGIKINSSFIHAVQVSGQVYFYTGTSSGSKLVYIYKNSTQICVTNGIVPSAQYKHFHTPTVTFRVSEGDVIYLRIKGSTNDLYKAYNTGTFMNVVCLK